MRPLPLAVAPLLLAAALGAQVPAPAPTAAAPVAAPAATGLRAELMKDIEALEKKYVALAEAESQAQLAYRPAVGVRSASEIFMHVAGANVIIAETFGVKPTPELSLQAMSEKVTEKAQVAAALRQSFAHARSAILAIPDADLEKPVKLFGQDVTVRRAMLLLVTHMHEHLGQSIAYARANGIVPPWSGT